MRKAPAFQFYPGDWLRDLALHTCSLAARGLWIDLLCLMWDGDTRGYLRVAGVALTADEVATLICARPDAVRKGLAELERRGVICKADDGAYFSKRMVRDERVRQARAEGGKLGGNPNLMNGTKVGSKVNLSANLRPTPASASASASDSSPSSASEVGGISEAGVVGPTARLRALRVELEWRIEEVWRVHLLTRERFWLQQNGRAPGEKVELTKETKAAIRAALKEHDGDRMGAEDRERWKKESPVRAAGIGLFLSPWHTGTDARNSTRYLEPWRPWKHQRGKPDPVPTFAQLYFEERAK